ncbi:MAG: hypothetical protein ACRD6X_04995 [Pyrinomonadaceae bacterium]
MTQDEKAGDFYQKPNLTGKAEEEIIRRAVVRLNGNILGVVIGCVAALVIFVATNWLVIKGGETVGPHLGLLSQYFIGYSVTFVGSLIGALYGFFTGYLSGLFVGWVYNAVLFLRRR